MYSRDDDGDPNYSHDPHGPGHEFVYLGPDGPDDYKPLPFEYDMGSPVKPNKIYVFDECHDPVTDEEGNPVTVTELPCCRDGSPCAVKQDLR